MNLLIVIAVLFLMALGASCVVYNLPWLWLLGYVVISLITFTLYWVDKRKAEKDQWRIPEKTLHISALLGGWPGALIAQQWLRHKSQKLSFKLVLWLTIIINIILFLIFTTELGRALQHAVAG